MSENYILNDDHTVRPAKDVFEWSLMFEDADKRRVAHDRIGGVTISTVFLGLDHSFGHGPPLIFETMIFGGEHNEEMWRYSTWDEAVEGHQKAVGLVKSGD